MKSEAKNTVNIKGLDKARVTEALKNEAIRSADAPGICRNVLAGEISHEQLCKRVTVDLCGDEFDERRYDSIFGKGAAQRAVDSIRAEQEGGADAAKDARGEKKEPSLEEQAEMTKEAVHKILDILKELPPTSFAVACMTLKMVLGPEPMGGMAGMLMMGGPFSPSALFRSVEKPMGWPTGMGPRGRFG